MTNFCWTTERIALMTERVAANIPFSEIGIELGCTRNAAIGKARRLKIKVPKKPKAERKPRPTTRVGRKRKLQLQPTSNVPHPPRPPCLLPDLDAHTCRWPLWQANAPENQKFYCAAWTPGVEFQQPYCVQHAKLAFQAARPSQHFVSYIPNRK